MSNFNDNDTTIRLFVNGAQPQEELARLTKRADELREGLKAADEAGDLKKFKALSRDLDGVNRKINQSKSVMQGVGIVLDDLSGTSMTGLRNTLRHLQREIHATKPNTEQWQKYAEEIRTVKERIAELNENLGVQPTLWGRIKTFADDVWPVFDLMSRGYDYVVSSMRKYVDAYAEMDQEMANVRKFTGMTETQVRALNEEFKKMDTRSSREQLDKLAQEAGRLGLSSSEEVLGFVRASDKINVALDELGDGATLTLSKLTDMFGDKERYGVEKSLLKTGSVINELSQSSSAAAPYLTEFAERLSGIGVQADISVAKIMGIGAVLDSNGHKVEAASTAISQILVRMMQDPAKYAEAAGLEVEHFTNLLRTDANEALLLLLKTLNQAGGLDVLAPMFKDMGENGSRAVTTLASLAKNVDLVRQRQAEATAAFAEGASVDKEFAVQNGTVQASLEKARKAAEEIRIELGERLAPLAAHFMLSSSSVARAIVTMITYTMKHKAALVGVASAIVVFTVAINASNIAFRVHYGWLVLTDRYHKTVAASAAVLRVAVTLLTKGLRAAVAEYKALNAVSSTTLWGAVAAAIGLAVAAIVKYATKTNLAAEANKRLKETMGDVEKGYRDEQREIDALFAKLDNAKKGTKEYEDAKKSILDQYGQYLSGLSNEIQALDDVAEAYKAISREARNAAKARGLASAQSKAGDSFNEVLGTQSGVLGDALSEVERRVRRGNESSREKLGGREIYKWQQRIIDAAQSNDFSDDRLITFLRSIGVYRSDAGTFTGSGAAGDVAGAINKIISAAQVYSKELDAAEIAFGTPASDFAGIGYENLKVVLGDLTKLLPDASSGGSYSLPNGKKLDYKDASELQNIISDLQMQVDKALDTMDGFIYVNPSSNSSSEDDSAGESITPKSDRFAQEKAWRTRQEAEARIAYAKGETAHAEHMESMSRIELEYYQKLLDRADLTSDERLSIEADYEEAAAKQRAAGGKAAIDEENRAYEELTLYLSQLYARRLSAQNLSEKERLQADRLYRETSEQAELNHLSRLVEMYEEGSEERLRAQQAYQSAQLEAQKRHQQEFEKQEAEYAKIKDDVFGDNPQQRQEKFDAAMDALQEVYEREIAAAGDNADEKLRIEEAFLQAQNRLRSEYAQEAEEDTRSSMERGVAAAAAWLKSEGGQALTGTLSTLTQGMASVFSGLSTMIQAELEIQTASINKKYEREVSLAQGNSYKVAQLEKKKEAEIAKIKNEANRKLFAMQVIQAVAQTAQNALAAFGSAAQVPVVGHILAPIAAAMAIAAGGIQVAAIKKQQQAAEAQGYSRGGFTKPGAVDEPAGIVHAGEWVASQRLLANPVARPMIEALDYAQRTNTIGSLRPEDVSRSITANNSLVRIAESDNAMVAMAAVAARMTDAVSGLNDRLNEPFVTVNTASGDKGINAAQDEYARLMRNKSPKSRKKK